MDTCTSDPTVPKHYFKQVHCSSCNVAPSAQHLIVWSPLLAASFCIVQSPEKGNWKRGSTLHMLINHYKPFMCLLWTTTSYLFWRTIYTCVYYLNASFSFDCISWSAYSHCSKATQGNVIPLSKAKEDRGWKTLAASLLPSPPRCGFSPQVWKKQHPLRTIIETASFSSNNIMKEFYVFFLSTTKTQMFMDSVTHTQL